MNSIVFSKMLDKEVSDCDVHQCSDVDPPVIFSKVEKKIDTEQRIPPSSSHKAAVDHLEPHGLKTETVCEELSTNFRSELTDICDKNLTQSSIMKLRLYKIDLTLGRFLCSVCEKRFKTNTELKNHLIIHNGRNEKQFVCFFCKKSFSQKMYLKKHIMGSHTEKKRYFCETCGKDFARKQSLDTHTRIHTGETPFACNFCRNVYREKRALTLHLMIHTGAFPFSCNICGKTFKRGSNLKTHVAIHSKDISFSCGICQQKFRRRHDMMFHVRKWHDGQPKDRFIGKINRKIKKFTCQICSKRFLSQKQFNTHMVNESHTQMFLGFSESDCENEHLLDAQVGMSQGEKTHECLICLKSFENQHQLNTHMVNESHTEVFTGFSESDCENEHLLDAKVGMSQEGKTHECLICLNGFENQDQLNTHMVNESHTEVFTGFSESDCENELLLDAQVGVSQEEKTHECLICLKGFENQDQLNTHMVNESHTEVFTGFSESDCENEYLLDTHDGIKQQRKTLECLICLEGFDNQQQLQTHMVNEFHTEVFTGFSESDCEDKRKHQLVNVLNIIM